MHDECFVNNPFTSDAQQYTILGVQIIPMPRVLRDVMMHQIRSNYEGDMHIT